jgi:hypothetical protein
MYRLKGAAMDRDTTSWVLRATAGIAVMVLLSAALAARGLAAEWRGYWGEGWHRHEGPHWGHDDIAPFHKGDLDWWRAGHWFHGEHFGRLGWWWVVGGMWYFYPAPVYPYSDPYVSPAVVTQAPPPSLTQSPLQYWYYYPSAKGYYPHVADCLEGWTPVTPQPTPPVR